MNTVAYITVNLLLFSSWYVFLFRKKEFISFVDRIIGTFILGLTQIIVTELLLGALFKKLYAFPLFIVNILTSTVILFITALAVHKGDSGNSFTFIGLVFIEGKEKVANILGVIKSDFILLCIFLLVLISTCWMLFIGYLFPSYTWDALWYHLPMVGYILQSGAIQDISTHSFINQWINMFPKNIELFFLWNIIFLQSDVIVDLSQLLFTIIGVIAIYNIALKLGIQNRYGLYAALLFFFTPIIILQSTTNYVDVAISVLFIIAVNFLICDSFENKFYHETSPDYLTQRKYFLILAGLATGILLGAKSSGPLFVVIVSAVIVIQELKRLFSSFKADRSLCGYALTKSLKLYFIGFLVPVLMLGSYWYIRTWMLNNNPVYPMEISFLGTTIFKGLYKGIVEPAPEIINRLTFAARPFYVWLENVEYYLYDSRLGGFGPIWVILFLPSIILSTVYAITKKNYNFMTVSSILIVSFLIYPRNWTPRYVIFIVGLGAVSFGFVLSHIGDRKNAIKIIALLLAVYTFFTANSPCINPEQIKKFIHLPANERTLARHAPFNIDLHVRQEYGYWIWISNNISKGDTLMFTFEPIFESPLWNSSYTNRIVYLKSETYREWLEELKRNSATYILLRTNSQEDNWIKMSYTLWFGSEERFKVVYSDVNYTIAKFDRVKG